MTTKISPDMQAKIETLVKLITDDTMMEMDRNGFTFHHASEAHAKEYTAHYHLGGKYIRVDVGSSGRYMVEIETGSIYGIKAYGVIHRGHYYGTLDTISEYFWGKYRAVKIQK